MNLSSRNVLILCLVMAAALSLPGLRIGLFMDDYFHVAILEGLMPFGQWWNLFDFAPGQDSELAGQIYKGILPWYTMPEMKASLFRPLSCLLSAADHALFGHRYELWHLHSVLWYLLLILALSLVFRRALPGAPGLLALVIFTLAPSHWFPVVWLANRNALVATTPVVLGLYAHIRWREDGLKCGLPLSLACYATGLLGGEGALCALAYVAAYEVIAGPGGLVERARSLAPATVVVFAYLSMYKWLGYGAYGSGSYIDPLREPLSYAWHAPARLLMLIGAQLAGISADLLVFAEWLRPVHVIAGLLTACVVAMAARWSWPTLDAAQRRALKWMSCGSVLSMLPVAATFPTNRLLLAPSIGASALIAILVLSWWRARREARAPRAVGVLAGFLLLVHVAMPPAMWVVQSVAFRYFGQHVERACMRAEVDGPLSHDGHYILLPGMDPITGIYTPIIRAVLEKRKLGMADFWLVTSQAPHDHRLTVTSAHGFEIEVVGGCMLDSEFERLFRGVAYPLCAGDRVDLGYVGITVIESGAVGPSKVAFDFAYLLEDGRLRFLRWQDGHVRRFQLPGIGETVTLPWERGLLAFE